MVGEMTSIETRLSEALKNVGTGACAGSADDDGIATLGVLRELARAWPGPLTSLHREYLDAICRKLALTGTLYRRYGENWKPAKGGKNPLDLQGATLAVATLLAWAHVPEQMGPEGRGLAYKLLNAALTALDSFFGEQIAAGKLAEQAEQLLSAVAVPACEIEGDAAHERGERRVPSADRTLPVTVLGYEGPCFRAYLSSLRRAGLRPERLVLLVLSEHPASHKPVGRWFPGRLRSWYAEKTQEMALNHWPRRLRAAHPNLVRAITDGLAAIVDRPGELIDDMYGPPRYERWAQRADRVVVRDLRDERLADALRDITPSTVLFTGGGILPARIIDLPGLRFLHVHPGHLPHVRGADGLLWSTLVRGRPAMSCFHLSAGLDTGDVIARREYPPLNLRLNGSWPDDLTLYRAVFAFIDPLLRADLLVNVLSSAVNPQQLATAPQDPSEGVTYHFMHPRLRRRVLSHLFGLA